MSIPVPNLGHGGNRRPSQWRHAGWAALSLAPTTIGLAVFYLWPAVQTFYYSFTTWGPFGSHEWSGLDNYRQLLHDPDLTQAFLNTLCFTAIGLLSIAVAI